MELTAAAAAVAQGSPMDHPNPIPGSVEGVGVVGQSLVGVGNYNPPVAVNPVAVVYMDHFAAVDNQKEDMLEEEDLGCMTTL